MVMDAAPIRAVVFDAVGTLIHADPAVAEVYHLIGWEHGSQLSLDVIGKRIRAAFSASESGEGWIRPPTSEPQERVRWQQIVAAVLQDVSDQNKLFRALWDHFAQPQSWRLFDDAAPVLNELSSRGYRLAIASNFDRRLHAIRQAHQVLRRCERCFVSSDLGFVKPDSRFFSAIESQFDFRPERLLMVGDDWTNDTLGARAAGWQAVQLSRRANGYEPEEIATLTSLLDMLPGF